MKLKSRTAWLVVFNTITLLVMLFANFASNTKMSSKETVADISLKYDTLFAPASYAFIIWLFIFLGCICFVIYQWVLLKKGDPENFIDKTGIYFSLSNIANGAWVYFWVNDKISICVVVILLLLL